MHWIGFAADSGLGEESIFWSKAECQTTICNVFIHYNLYVVEMIKGVGAAGYIIAWCT